MADVRRVYIDTCCLIDLVQIEVGRLLTTEKEKDVWHVKHLMEAQRDGEIQLFTSTLTIAECRHAGEKPVTEKVKAAFTRLLLSGQYVRLVQMTPFIAQDARDLTWRHQLNVKGADSIHVASALDRKCDELLTGDGRLGRLGALGAPLQKLGLAVLEARNTQSLPDKYKQMDIEDGGAVH